VAEGFAADPFFFEVAGARLFRSSYVVAAPAGLGLEVDGHGMPAPPVVREGPDDVVRAVARDVPAHVPEPGGPSSTEHMPFLHVGVGGGREALQLGLADAIVDRTRPTEDLRALAREVRAAAGPGASPAALARAAWARVARAVLGQGGALGEEASVVLSRGRGGRLVVLKALLSELGLRARIALARPFSADPSPWRFPSHSFSYPLLRIEAGGETVWTDPSLRLGALGTLPAVVEDVEALVLPEPGEAPEVARTPSRPRGELGRELRIRIDLAEDGTAAISGEDRYGGAVAAAAKAALEQLDALDRRHTVEAMLARSFRGLQLTEASISGEDDPDAPLVIRWRGSAPKLARQAGDRLVLDAEILPIQLGAEYVRVAGRTTPLLVASPMRLLQRLELSAPAGLAAVTVPSRSLETPFGSFVRKETSEGGVLVREDRLDLERGRITPDRYAGFAAFAAAVDEAQAQETVFAPGQRPRG
jgi:hypothetical protein